MNWKELFGFTKIKLMLFIVVIILINFIQVDRFCSDPGGCIDYYGIPFRWSIINDHWGGGLLSIIGNILVAYLGISLIFYVYCIIEEYFSPSKKK
jgi:hypothetical protein